MDIYVDKRDRKKSISQIQIGEQIVQIDYWYSWRKQLTEEEFNDYLQLEALSELDMVDEALSLAQPKASGELIKTIDEEGFTSVTDTRNWYQNWIDNNLIGE